jgi:hypothetical protein
MSDTQDTTDDQEGDGKEPWRFYVKDSTDTLHAGKVSYSTEAQARSDAEEVIGSLDDGYAVFLETDSGFVIIPAKKVVSMALERSYGYGISGADLRDGAISEASLRHTYPTPNLQGRTVYAGGHEGPSIGGPAGSGFETPLEQRG